MAFPPQAFIIGAQKSATTSLADILSQHPQIVLSNPKEPDFFNVNWDRGLDWYRSCFSRTQGILIDASVSYTMLAARDFDKGNEYEVPERISSLSPNAKFIYIVRDPADRCYSAYWHEVRAGREKRPLRAAIERSPYYAMASYYFRQIQRFQRYFPLERFHIIPFEQFHRDPVAVARECAAFLGADYPDFAFVHEGMKNQGFQYNRMGRALQSLSKFSGLLPGTLKSLAKRIFTEDLPKLRPEDRAWLTARFRDDARSFEKLTGVRVLSGEDSG